MGITNCTIANNNNYGFYGYCGVISNSIVWNNDTGDFSGQGTGTVTFSCTQTPFTGTGNISTNPEFIFADGGDFHLASDSLCVDAGSPLSDYSLEPSPNGGRIDMGAYGNTANATI